MTHYVCLWRGVAQGLFHSVKWDEEADWFRFATRRNGLACEDKRLSKFGKVTFVLPNKGKTRVMKGLMRLAHRGASLLPLCSKTSFSIVTEIAQQNVFSIETIQNKQLIHCDYMINLATAVFVMLHSVSRDEGIKECLFSF